MELFITLFSDLLVFVYHCFDRIVIHGYLSGLSRPEQVVHFFRQVVGAPVVSKELLSQRTSDYQNWVEAFARNHKVPIQWAEKGVCKEDYVQPWLRRMVRKDVYGVYFIFKSMEQGPTFRVTVPKYPTKDPNHRILAGQRSRFTHDYFYIRDEVLGPIVMRAATFFPFQATYYLNGHSFIEQELNRAKIGFRKSDNPFLAVDDVTALQAAADKLNPAIIRERLDYWTLILGPKFSAKERKRINLSRFYAISQIEYCRNFIFKRHFPIHKLFERSCELGLWRLTSNKISEIFGQRLHRRLSGKLATVIDQIEHGHHVFRAYFKHAFLKQYEKFSTFLRRWSKPTQRGTRRLAGIDLNKARNRHVMDAVVALSTRPSGFTLAQVAEAVQQRAAPSTKAYTSRNAAYDLAKLSGKKLVHRVKGPRRYKADTSGVRAMCAYLVLRDKVIKPLLAGVVRPLVRAPKVQAPIDQHYVRLREELNRTFETIGLAPA